MDFTLVVVISLLIILSPMYFLILLTSRLSVDAKLIIAAVSFILLTVIPLLFFLFHGKMGT